MAAHIDVPKIEKNMKEYKNISVPDSLYTKVSTKGGINERLNIPNKTPNKLKNDLKFISSLKKDSLYFYICYPENKNNNFIIRLKEQIF